MGIKTVSNNAAQSASYLSNKIYSSAHATGITLEFKANYLHSVLQFGRQSVLEAVCCCVEREQCSGGTLREVLTDFRGALLNKICLNVTLFIYKVNLI